MAINEGSDVETFQQRSQQGQGPQVDNLLGACGTMPSEAHGGCSFDGANTVGETGAEK